MTDETEINNIYIWSACGDHKERYSEGNFELSKDLRYQSQWPSQTVKLTNTEISNGRGK